MRLRGVNNYVTVRPVNTYKRLLAYISPYKGRLTSAIVCMFFFSVANSLVSALPYIVINGLYHKDRVIINNIPHVPFLVSFSFPAF